MEPPVPFHVGVNHVGRRVVIAPVGELDIATVGSLRDALSRPVEEMEAVVLDLRGLDFMDTVGIRLVIEQQRRCVEKGLGFALIRGPEHVQRLLDMAGLTAKLRILDAAEEPNGVLPSSD